MLNMDWNRFRELMPITRRWVYLDHSAVAPLPEPSAQAVVRWSQEAASEGDTVWPQWYRRLGEVRQRAATMLNAGVEEIALVPSTTSGISLVAEGYPWRAGDNVVTLENEFPSNLYPWMNLADRGVQTRRVAVPGGRVDLNRIADACDARTRIVAISWVGYASGWRIDVPELARLVHDHGPCCCWMRSRAGRVSARCSASGRGFSGGGWSQVAAGTGGGRAVLSAAGASGSAASAGRRLAQRRDAVRLRSGGLQLRPEAARYEGGSQNMVGFIGLGASLDLLAEFGLVGEPSRRWPTACCRSPSWRCPSCGRLGAEILSPGGWPAAGWHRDLSPARSFTGGSSEAVPVGGHRVELSWGGLRISPHAYNHEADVERLMEVLRSAHR